MKHKLGLYFKNCLYFTSGSLFRRVERMANPIFLAVGVAPIHAFVLMALSERKTLSPSELADILELDRSTITRHLDVLFKKGLIDKNKMGKVVSVNLTKDGKKKIILIEKAWDDLYKRYNSEWGKKESEEINNQIFLFLNSN